MARLACPSVNIQHSNYTVCVLQTLQYCDFIKKCVKNCLIEEMFTSVLTHLASYFEAQKLLFNLQSFHKMEQIKQYQKIHSSCECKFTKSRTI